MHGDVVMFITVVVKFNAQKVGDVAHKCAFPIKDVGEFLLEGLFHCVTVGEVDTIINVGSYINWRFIWKDFACEETRGMRTWFQAKLFENAD